MAFYVRFNLIVEESSHEAGRTLALINLTEGFAPLPGEIVNLNGELYKVVSRGWILSKDEDTNVTSIETRDVQLFLRLVAAS